MLKTDVFNGFLLLRVLLIQVPVNAVETYINPLVFEQIIGRLKLAEQITQSGNHKVSEQ